jgi:hypothetical protein
MFALGCMDLALEFRVDETILTESSASNRKLNMNGESDLIA